MTAILALLGGKVGVFALGLGLPIVFMMGKKYLPKYFGGLVAKLLGQGISGMDKINDPAEKQLVMNIALAVVKWAEYKLPDDGAGAARYEMAAAKLCTALPFLKGRDADIARLIESAVVAMDKELKAFEEFNKKP